MFSSTVVGSRAHLGPAVRPGGHVSRHAPRRRLSVAAARGRGREPSEAAAQSTGTSSAAQQEPIGQEQIEEEAAAAEGPWAGAATAEAASTLPPTPQEAWQGVRSYLQAAEARATRSPTSVLTTVGAVAVAALLVGTALRKLLVGRGPPGVKVISVKEPGSRRRSQPQLQNRDQELQQWRRLQQRLQEEEELLQQARQPTPPSDTAAAAEAAPAAAAPAAPAPPLEQQAPSVEVTPEPVAQPVAALASEGEPTAAAPVDSQDTEEGSAAGREALRAAPPGRRHPLLAAERVYLLRQQGGQVMRLSLDVGGTEQRCTPVFEEREDAAVLLRQLAALMGFPPGSLTVAPEPASRVPALLQWALEGGQALAFYPGGALQILDEINPEGMAKLLEDDAEAAIFEDNLQRLTQDQAEILGPAELADLAQRAQQGSGGGSTAAKEVAGRGAVGSAAPGVQASGSTQRGSDGEGPTLQASVSDANPAQPQPGQQPQAGGQGQSPPAPAANPAQQQAEQPQGQPGPEEPQPVDWWLSLPVVHVPQLRYEDGATGLMIVSVASLKGALEGIAAAAGSGGPGGGGGRAALGGSSSSNGSSSNGAGLNGNGAGLNGASSNGGRAQQAPSRPVERHIVAFQRLEDARALSLSTLQSEQGEAAIKVQTLALPPKELLDYARGAGCIVAVLPAGAVAFPPGARFEELVGALHDAVQDSYWLRMAEGIKAFQREQAQQAEEGDWDGE